MDHLWSQYSPKKEKNAKIRRRDPADFALRKEERKNEKDEQQTYYLYNN